MSKTERAYTWGVVTYATPEEFQPLLDSAKNWCYTLHDKDWVVDDTGERKPKEPHYHIILSFENEQSFKQVRERVVSAQNTLAQRLKNQSCGKESVRGLYDYLTHRNENPEEKYIYDDSIRVSNDIAYWEHRCRKELAMLNTQDSFYEDLLSDDFDIALMGRKYGRDFIRNMKNYCAYRNAVLQERRIKREKELWQELEEFCVENMISWEEARQSLYYISVELHARREADKLFNQKTGY